MRAEADFYGALESFVGGPVDADVRLDQLSPFRRMALTQHLAEWFEQPADHAVVRQIESAGEAWAWVRDRLERGERVRVRRGPDGGGASAGRVRLRAVRDDDLLPIYHACVEPPTSLVWRYRGQTPSIAEFVEGFHDGVRCQFVAELTAEQVPVGLVVAYDHHAVGLHCKVGFVRFGPRHPAAADVTLEGMVLLVSHLFSSFPYRKVYAELPSYNLALLERAYLAEEGVLRDHVFADGRWVDLHVVSVTREAWSEVRQITGW